MMGRPFQVDWREDEATLGGLYRKERDGQRRTRLQALWLLRQGKSLRETAAVVGVNYRTVQQWVAWYRSGGLAEAGAHRRTGPGRTGRLTLHQQKQLREQAAQGSFRTAQDAVVWVGEQFGVQYRRWGMYDLLHRLRIGKKVPRPLAEKADLAAQEAWKKGA